MLRTAALAALAGAVFAANWLRLERPRESAARVLVLVLIGIAPALLRPRWLRALGTAVAVLAAAAVAFSLSPLDLWPDGGRFFGPLGSRFAGAVADFYSLRLPIDPTVHARMHMLLLAAVFAFTLVTALAVAARRSVFAVASLLVGAGWPATLLAGGHEVVRGAVILATALVLLAGLGGRGARFALPASVALVLSALALSTSPAVAKTALLDWQHWNPYRHADAPVSLSYVWNGSYAGIRFPRRRTTVLTIAAPASIGTYWRATALDAYVGGRWIERPWHESPREARLLLPAFLRSSGRVVLQDVTVAALRDRHLVGASMPVAYDVPAPVDAVGQNVALTAVPLARGERYGVRSYTPQPTPRELVGLSAAYPRALTAPGRELELAPGVTAPPFGTRGRDAFLRQRLRGPLTAYRALLARARAVVGTTDSPYAAMVALERWFRTTGGFVYSERPPVTPGVPPLVGFVLKTKTGYCQHFAGAMALMARLLGVPARVAAGFVSGRYDNGTWTVTDHDAHTWVEVWFQRFGWLPFDPTPGRGRLAATYTDASLRFDAAAATRLLSHVTRGGEVFGGRVARSGTEKRGPNLHSRAAVSRGRAVPATPGGGQSVLRFLMLFVLTIVALIVVAKLVRRRLRYVTRDPRQTARACACELGDFLADQRFPFSRLPTVRELHGELSERLAVDAWDFVCAVERARFGPPTNAADEAKRACRELRELKRRLRRRIGVLNRSRGVVSLRSLGFA